MMENAWGDQEQEQGQKDGSGNVFTHGIKSKKEQKLEEQHEKLDPIPQATPIE